MQRLFTFTATFILIVGATFSAIAAPVLRQGSGASTAALQSTIDQFRYKRYLYSKLSDALAQARRDHPSSC